jgi:formylglycine-generating enzyme required for sulfatase activity
VIDVPCNTTEFAIGTHPTAQRSPNGYGLYDMAGNVWEWVLECSAGYAPGEQVDPVGQIGCDHTYKIYRGGGVGNVASFCRHAERAAYAPGGRMRDIGFRPVRTLP